MKDRLPGQLRPGRSRSLLIGVAVALVSLATAATASATTWYVSPTGTDSTTCNTQSTPCQTIGQAVSNASNGDTVSVAPGTYTFTHDVTIDKSITLAGAQYGVDGRTRALPASASSESILTGTSSSDAFLDIEANGVVIDGFTIQDNTGGPGIAALGTDDADYQIRNNIIDGNVFGIYANSAPSAGGGGSVIAGNLITNNNAPGAASGNGIYADAGTHDLTVTGNAFSDDTNGAAIFVAGGNQDNIHVTDNSFSNEDPVIFYGVNDSSVSGNTFTAGGGNTNPLYALAIDGGHDISVTGNTVDGLLEGAFKIYNEPSNFGADEISSGVQIVGNSITNTGAAPRPAHVGGAIQVLYDGSTALHAYAGTLEVHDNRFAGNAAAIVNQDSTVPIDASDNFWGCNAGAGQPGCDGTSGSGITTEPHLVLTLTADQPQLIAGGEATGVHPSLAQDSSGAVSAGPFPAVPVSLATTLGTVSPTDPLLDPVSGIASSRLTSGASGGTATVTAQLDNATATTTVRIAADAGSPGPAGPPGPYEGGTPDVATLVGAAPIHHGRLRVTLRCAGASGQLCIGIVTLTVHRRHLTATYAIRTGKTAAVTILVPKQVAKFIASRRHGAPASFYLSTEQITGDEASASGRVTLKG